MIIRCVCLGLLTITLAGCNKTTDRFISFTPVSLPQDHNVSYPLLQLQLDKEIHSRLTAQIAENLSKNTNISDPYDLLNTSLENSNDDIGNFDLAGHMTLHCTGLCDQAHLKGPMTIAIDLDNRHFALDNIHLTDIDHGIMLTGSINQFLYGYDYIHSLADANLILRTPDEQIEIINKATLLMIKTPSAIGDPAIGQVEIIHHDSNVYLWGDYSSVKP
jgi:hypothetical protein